MDIGNLTQPHVLASIFIEQQPKFLTD